MDPPFQMGHCKLATGKNNDVFSNVFTATTMPVVYDYYTVDDKTETIIV